ncbi:unnamed protein product [Moneuplotes crassus]|uniref:Uncharacterized protein n=1 Tax=Euplotes crassus TaxID=5936 RepID=A0AAD1XP85_EUPCR|nr:unnamed protein product [Moneuplotes crassus]
MCPHLSIDYYTSGINCIRLTMKKILTIPQMIQTNITSWSFKFTERRGKSGRSLPKILKLDF